MAVKQRDAMPLSLVVRDPATLTQSPNDAVSFELDETSDELPLVLVTVEDEHNQSVQAAFNPSQLDACVEELKKLQCIVQWQMARCRWLFVRYSPKSKWHLRLRQWGGGHICTYKRRHREAEYPEETSPAGTTLWGGNVCAQCVHLWTEQILSGWVRYQYAHSNRPVDAVSDALR